MPILYKLIDLPTCTCTFNVKRHIDVYFLFVAFLQDQELFQTVDKAFDEAWEIIHSEDGWKEEKKSDETNDVVFSKKNSKGM